MSRKTMTIIVLPNVKKFHFCQKELSGIDHNAWYPYTEGELFEAVEQKLVSAGFAVNVTGLDELARMGCSIDYRVTYNASTYKSENASKVLTLMDSFEDGQDRYGEFVKQVAAEAGISTSQLEAELEPFI